MKDIGTFFEKLRLALNQKREDFICDIVDLRQYQRFVNKEATPYMEDFIRIVANTNISISEALDLLLDEVVIERKKITRLYNLVISKDYKEFNILLETIKRENIMENKNLLLYDYSILIYNYEINVYSNGNYVTYLKELINYPTILNKSLLSLYELMILFDLLFYLPKVETEKVISKLHSSLEKQIDLTSSYERNDRLLLLVAKFANYIGQNGEYAKSIDLCNKGITLSLKYKEFYILDYFFYYKALGLYNTADIMNSNNSIIYSYLVLVLKNNESELKKFLKWFSKDFNIPDFELFLKTNMFSALKLF